MEKRKTLTKNYDLLESIRVKRSMASEIVKKDKDYSYYAGADPDTADQLVLVKLCLDKQLLPKAYTPLLELYQAFLTQKRKSFFAGPGSTEITKLGFIQGEPLVFQDAQKEIK